MKKLTALLLVLIMMLGLVACGTPAAAQYEAKEWRREWNPYTVTFLSRPGTVTDGSKPIHLITRSISIFTRLLPTFLPTALVLLYRTATLGQT